MVCSQSDTYLATIPWTISSVKYFCYPNLLTKKNGLKSLLLNENGDRITLNR